MNALVTSNIETLVWDAAEEPGIIRKSHTALEETGLVRVSGFPTIANTYVKFLSNFGEPLPYYGNDAGTHPESSVIWQIKFDREAAARGETHALDGPLPAHSSQSVREPRPRYFSMLMVDHGWQHFPFASNGESLLAPWRLAFERMRLELGSDFHAAREALFGQVPFPDGADRAVAYELASSRSADDLGVRLKSDLLAFLEASQPTRPYTTAVRQLANAAQNTALRVGLRTGDLVLLDNDRWGHGRESVVGSEPRPDGILATNPRELWSVTID